MKLYKRRRAGIACSRRFRGGRWGGIKISKWALSSFVILISYDSYLGPRWPKIIWNEEKGCEYVLNEFCVLLNETENSTLTSVFWLRKKTKTNKLRKQTIGLEDGIGRASPLQNAFVYSARNDPDPEMRSTNWPWNDTNLRNDPRLISGMEWYPWTMTRANAQKWIKFSLTIFTCLHSPWFFNDVYWDYALNWI